MRQYCRQDRVELSRFAAWARYGDSKGGDQGAKTEGRMGAGDEDPGDGERRGEAGALGVPQVATQWREGCDERGLSL